MQVQLTPSQYEAGRGFRSVVWTLQANSGAVSSALAAVLSAAQNSPTLSIPPALLAKATAYTLQAAFTNFLSTQGQSVLQFTPTGCLEVSAQLSDDLKTLLVNFTNDDFTLRNSALNLNSQPSSDLCTYLFASATLLKFGTTPLCQ